ncbi:TIM barrel protein [Candidatus Woesearchaeota archaeon]|nr:TIM barrel protein [Candidatus Woesearchaeota archaeon]
MSKILFGHAGSGGLGNEEGVKHSKELGLDAMEVAFTYGVRMSNAEAKKVGQLAKELGIKLSVHGPYYINLASKEKAKLTASKKRILQSCERAHHLGASPVVFHAGFYQGRNPEDVYKIIKEQIQDLQKTIKKNKWKVKLAPETTGKPSQFAGLEDLLRLKKSTGCSICIDFAHLYARTQGKIDYNEIMKKIKHLSHIHCHFSGITFGSKGERSHKLLDKRFFNPLAKAIKKHKPKSITIINESPDVYGDAVKMKKWFGK